jgi:hypothetical protein
MAATVRAPMDNTAQRRSVPHAVVRSSRMIATGQSSHVVGATGRSGSYARADGAIRTYRSMRPVSLCSQGSAGPSSTKPALSEAPRVR